MTKVRLCTMETKNSTFASNYTQFLTQITHYTVVIEAQAASRDLFVLTDRIWLYGSFRHTAMEHIPTIENVTTSDLIIVTRLVGNISSRSSQPEMVSWRHTAPYIANVIKITNHILDTLSTQFTEQRFTDFSKYVTVCVQHLWAILHDENVREWHA